MTSREETTWIRRENAGVPGTFAWFKDAQRTTLYDYFNGQLQGIATVLHDYCDTANCDTCSPLPGEDGCSTDPVRTFRAEFHTFDLFGRRVSRAVCDRPCSVDPLGSCPGGIFTRCQMDHTQYDYDGLSNQVLVERRGPWQQDIDDPGNPLLGLPPYPSTTYVGDRFLASYTYGPLGPIARTAEYDDNDAGSPTTNNRDYYYLRDAMGGHVGVLFDDDGVLGTAGVPSFAVYDSFGNHMAASLGGAGSYAWRGVEGSVTDGEPNLLHMQARHYDPTLGRFIQADTVMLASMTTQGMNRYIYCENDPVNMSDATGHFVWLLLGMIVLGGIVGGIYSMITAGATTEHFVNGFIGGAIAGFFAALFLPEYLGLAALGVGAGNLITSILEDDPLAISVAKGLTSCYLAFGLLHGERALPWGFLATYLFYLLANLLWDYFTGGSFSLRYIPAKDDANSERLCLASQTQFDTEGRPMRNSQRKLAPLGNRLHRWLPVTDWRT